MLQHQLTVSVIIPAYNEEATITTVVGTALKSDLVAEVLVINDSSTDKTSEVLPKNRKKVRLLTNNQNSGKGYSLYRGFKNAKSPVVVCLDGDLINLTKDHIQKLVQPILKKKRG